ncbi:MAG: DUF302 domain-containing protein [Candidatus Limnocylindrales bacterium]
MTSTVPYTIATRVPGSVAEIRPLVEAALKAEGFGILTEIDVAATMQSKLGVAWVPHIILGACNPMLAHRALVADVSIGALLPCNVVLRTAAAQDTAEPAATATATPTAETIVEAMDPQAALGIVEAPAVREIAAEARQRLVRAIDAMATGR